MLKLLRRYNKIILVFGGCLLMIVFLVPSVSMQGRGGGVRKGETMARFDGGRMTAGDYIRSQRELEALSIIRFTEGGGSTLAEFMGIESVEHWFLLSMLAEQAGLVGGPQDGRALLASLAEDRANEFVRRQADANPSVPRNQFDSYVPILRDSFMQNFEMTREAALRRAGQTEDWVDRVLSRAYGVFRMIAASRADFSLSRAEAIEYGRRLFDTVTADILVIPAQSVASELTPPDEARIAAHFERFRGVRASDDPHGIGYRRAPAVKLEFLSVDNNMLKAGLTLDAIEVNRFWRQNRAEFPGEFAQERLSVEAEFRRREVERTLQRVREATDSRIKLALSQQARSAPGSAGAAPGVSIEDVAAIIRRQLGEGPAVQSQVTIFPASDQWLDAVELNRLPGIPQSSWRATDRLTLPFVQVVMSLPELGAPPNPALQAERERLRVGAPFGPLFDPAGNMYYYRVIEARPEGPADSIDEVRDRILADIAALDGLALLETRADELRRELAEKGLGAMLDRPGANFRSVIDARITNEFLRQDQSTRVFPELDDPGLRSAVMDRVMGWDPFKDLADMPQIDRIVAAPNTRLRSLVLVQIKSRFPMTAEQMAANEGSILSLARNLQEQVRQSVADSPFSFARLSERTGFRILGDDRTTGENPAPNPGG